MDSPVTENIKVLNELFCDITDKLNAYSLNYVSDVEIYSVSNTATGDTETIVKSVFGEDVVLGGVSKSTKQTVFEELSFGLSYVGDSGAHSNIEYVNSGQYKSDLSKIKETLDSFIESDAEITSFWFKEGEPFCVVFWGFSFLIDQGGERYILNGASSD